MSGLSTNVPQEELCDFVKSINCGDYESLWRQQNKRFAFIRYGTPKKALDAMLRLHGSQYKQRMLTVRSAYNDYSMVTKNYGGIPSQNLCVSGLAASHPRGCR